MKTPVQGLHHLTAMAGDPQRNADFFVRVLGQRLVKVTVNFDDPGTYHLYYGDEVGSPGTIMTYFPWPGARRGSRGNGEATALAYAVSPHALNAWKARLTALEVDFQESARFGSPVLSFQDPDGLTIELVAEDGAEAPRPWAVGPVGDDLILRGFHSVTLWAASAQSVRTLLVAHLGFAELGSEADPQGRRIRFKGDSDGVGLYVDVVERPGLPGGAFGAGSIHHVALRTKDDAEQEGFSRYLREEGYEVTPVQDRQYFRSIYFRDPSGVLFEIATDAPGFAADEAVSELGSHLKLPEWLEGRRAAIEARLPRLVSPEYGAVLGGKAGGHTSAHPAQGERREGQPVYAAGRPTQEARVAAILLHGRGGSARDVLSLAEALNLSAFAYLAPQAGGNSWYPRSFLAPLEENEPELSSGLAVIGDILAQLEAQGIPPEHVVLGGFSQGACLALEYVARHPRRYGGVFAFSGGLIGPGGAPREYGGHLDGTPIFIGCDAADSRIPLGRVEESAEVLSHLGAEVDKRIYEGLGHALGEDEIAAARAMMRRLALESV